MSAVKEYEIELPGLAEAAAVCPPEPGHKALVKALRRLPGLQEIKLGTTRGEDGGSYLARRGVYGPDGVRLHDDHEAWLRLQVESDGGNVRSTYERLKGNGYRLSKVHIAMLYLVVDRGGDESNFVQVEIWREHERMDCELLKSWGAPRDVDELVREAEGYSLPDEACVPVAPARYEFKRAADVGRFVKLLESKEAKQREMLSARRYRLLNEDRNAEVRTHAQIDPGFDRFPHKARRLFNDWATSSAGRSGARLCDHWVMQLGDWTNPKTGERGMNLIPVWTFGKKLAEVKAGSGDVYTFFGKLQTLDRRVGVPFAWYFFMLHGNRVHDWSGERVLKAAEDGLIVVPEHDYRVLKAWSQRPYGF
ncbi:MAG: hypothetical protein EPN64_04640 [Burkholderiaceae bacterium]|nr:MAG: hypothetical protein EPN64_04640 [Burkholderiaceae bacterium]